MTDPRFRLTYLVQTRVREQTGETLAHLARLWGRTPSQVAREIIEDWIQSRARALETPRRGREGRYEE